RVAKCSFFFQAEDGIRDFHVTGVQTCALPILRSGTIVAGLHTDRQPSHVHRDQMQSRLWTLRVGTKPSLRESCAWPHCLFKLGLYSLAKASWPPLAFTFQLGFEPDRNGGRRPRRERRVSLGGGRGVNGGNT